MFSPEWFFAESMRRAREKAGVSQQALAERMVDAGFPWRQSTVHSVERGGRRVQLNEAVAIADALDISLYEALGWQDADAAENGLIFMLSQQPQFLLDFAARVDNTASDLMHQRTMLAEQIKMVEDAGGKDLDLRSAAENVEATLRDLALAIRDVANRIRHTADAEPEYKGRMRTLNMGGDDDGTR